MIVIQIVEILWTKATRGAPRSNERVALPRAFAIAPFNGDVSIQYLCMAEWKDFRVDSRESRQGSLSRIHEGAIGLQLESPSLLGIDFIGEGLSGQPRRRSASNVMRLSQGQYGRLIVNQRHSTHSGQYYSEDIFNIAFGEDIAADCFVASVPDAIRDFRIDLF